MFGGIDLPRLFDWSVIKPEDDVVVVVEFRACHRDRFIGVMGEDGERACGVEAYSPDCGRVNAVLAQNALYRRANAAPDVVGRLFLYHFSSHPISS